MENTIGSISIGTQFSYQGCVGTFIKIKDSDGVSCKCVNTRTGRLITIPNISKVTKILSDVAFQITGKL